jgi:carbon-monoxide dehydrogenase medium subunit
MKPAEFEYLRPQTVDEALAMLAASDDVKVLAGGQSLVPLLRFRLTYFDGLVDIGRLAGLSGIFEHSSGQLRIGAMTRQSEAERDPAVRRRCPLLSEALPLIAHAEIRNSGTVGGSVAHADPAAELPAVAVALDATLVSRRIDGEREHDAAEFFTSYFSTALRHDELLTEIRIPASEPGEGACILETARRPGDFALVGAVARVRMTSGRCQHARVVTFGVAARPIRSQAAEYALIGTALTERDIADAARIAAGELQPPSDVHASSRYRRHAAQVLCRRALASARQRAHESQHGAMDAA